MWNLSWLASWLALVGAVSFQDLSSLLADGRRLLDEKRFSQAESVFRMAAAVEPGEPAPHYYLGVALLGQGKNEQAARALEQAYHLSPTPNPSVLYELGTAYLRMERLDESERVLLLAAEQAPGEARVHLQLGWLYYLKVEGEKAEAEFRRALDLSPTPVAHYYLALAELALGKIEDAVASCRAAIASNPSFPAARVVLGKMLAQLGRFEEAKKELKEALRLDPKAAEAHYQLGLMSLRGKDLKRAAELFRSAVEADPSHQGAWYNLALVYEQLGRAREAHQARARFEALSEKARRRGKSLSTASPEPHR